MKFIKTELTVIEDISVAKAIADMDDEKYRTVEYIAALKKKVEEAYANTGGADGKKNG